MEITVAKRKMMQADITQEDNPVSADRPSTNIFKRRICLLSVIIGLIFGVPLRRGDRRAVPVLEPLCSHISAGFCRALHEKSQGGIPVT